MPLEPQNFGRRAEDKGMESPMIMLARIDERVKNIGEKLTVHMVSFEEHKIDDSEKFDSVNKWVWIGVGIVGTLQVLVLCKH